MITEKLITDAWVFLRTNNNSIPDDVLDFIKDSSLAALRQQNLQQCNVVRKLKCQHDWHTFFNKGYRKCNKCGEEYCIKAF